ncbi:membrane protein [Clostridium acetobutylicum EA 2018]|uniref:Predicted membrane protein n=2 Tax=Clostridiaceae TaxID=31979 RepID=Q97HU7_CLOAB|nr:Predicted membrane protein [Clostridium acetobutylicum ATCC 824]ADZ20962.1 membrane protein [Clostridium acetobutylicum EA 2018]AEI32050.1 hypothetical protein SMB_G1938 [Clostridium acetobutylicum DSM 1731]AWV79696.1 hypothetical protein DK921_06195 [Clostridium acetobutylicum]PSM07657.1 hypothetical protein C7T89_06195 [Clostridium sp. NJ4]
MLKNIIHLRGFYLLIQNIVLKGGDNMNSNKKYFKNLHITYGLSLATVGIILFLLANVIKNSFFNGVINNIASAVLISGIFSLIDNYLLKDSLVSLILDKVHIKEQIDETGLESMMPGIADINYKYYIKEAQNNIDIVHIYGRTWTSTNIEEVTDRLLNSDCCVRVVLVHPDSLFVPALEEHFGYEKGELKNLINEVSCSWKKKYNKKLQQGKKATKSTFKLYYHKGQPTNAMYRIDDRIIVVQTKTTKEKTTRMPSMIFKDTGKEKCFYNIYLKEINQLIKEADPIELNSI